MIEASTAPEVGELPDFDPDALDLYRTEQDARLQALLNDPPSFPSEIGYLPLSMAALEEPCPL